MESNKPKQLNVPFWEKSTKNACSHVKGLTKENIEFFQKLKEGDRLILYVNDREGDTQPKYTLKQMRNDDGGGQSNSSGGL